MRPVLGVEVDPSSPLLDDIYDRVEDLINRKFTGFRVVLLSDERELDRYLSGKIVLYKTPPRQVGERPIVKL
jgi:hypothetical protein